MSFRAYHKETTRYLAFAPYTKTKHESFATAAAAKAAITREAKRGAINADDFAVADSDVFYKTIEKTVTKRNALTGKEFQQPANTPWCCDPSSETYHSM